jgi:predicted  nucleic acid-binding Zn-ribbon protein
VNEQLRALIELQELDRQIISYNNTIQTIPDKIKAMDPPIKSAEEYLASAKTRHDALEKKKKGKELAVEEQRDKVEKAKTRTADIKDNKAYQAHLKEIETLEKMTFNAEDEILALMEELEPLGAEVKAAEDSLAVQKQKAEELRKKLEAEVAEAQRELESMKAERNKFVEPLEKNNFELYMDLLTSQGGVAVAEVDNEVCGGCFMTIMPQLRSEVKKGENIIQCPQCKRILYFKTEEES